MAASFTFKIMHLIKSNREKVKQQDLLTSWQPLKKVKQLSKENKQQGQKGEQIPNIVQSVSETNYFSGHDTKNIYALPGLNCINQIQSSSRTAPP